jgi:hypothetical protein
MQLENIALNAMLDTAQREELLEFVRSAPDTPLGVWLKQVLPENGGTGHVTSHTDEVAVALVAALAASHNALTKRVAVLEESLEESLQLVE